MLQNVTLCTAVVNLFAIAFSKAANIPFAWRSDVTPNPDYSWPGELDTACTISTRSVSEDTRLVLPRLRFGLVWAHEYSALAPSRYRFAICDFRKLSNSR